MIVRDYAIVLELILFLIAFDDFVMLKCMLHYLNRVSVLATRLLCF